MLNRHGLFFEDFFDDATGKKEPNGEERITFIYPWMFNMNEINYDDTDGEQQRKIEKHFGVHHKFGSYQFLTCINFQSNRLTVENCFDWMEESSCSASYEVFADDEMRFRTYNSSTMDLPFDERKYEIHSATFLQRLGDAAQKYHEHETNCRVVVYLKLQMPLEFFLQPCEYRMVKFDHEPGKLPVTDGEIAFLYDYVTKSDFKIKCLDGEIPANKKQLFVASLFFQKIIKNDYTITEWAVNHNMDVVQPVIAYMHSLCFEMPKVYDFDFAQRIFAVIDFLQPINESDVKKVVFISISKKISREPPTFFAILQWLHLAIRPSTTISSTLEWLPLSLRPFEGIVLKDLICPYIATEFHMKWVRIFPPHLRTPQNPEYAQLVVPGATNVFNNIFADIDSILSDICITNVILP